MRRTLLAALLTVTALVATACDSPRNTPTSSPTSTGAAFPVTVGSVTLDKRPERIVVLSPTATEMLYAIDAGTQVVAVDSLSTYPTNAPKTDLSAYQPNAEAITKYQPDLVVLSNDIQNIAAQLKTLKVPTFVSPAAKNLDETYAEIADLGRLTGHHSEAQALVERMHGDIYKILKDVPKRSKPLTYYYELDPSYFSVTSQTFIGSLFTMAGMVNIADAASKDGNAYPQMSAEVIVKANPDFIFLADTKCCGQSAETVAKRSGWANVTAIQSGQVVGLDDDIASRWGPRVVDLLQAIASAVAKAPTT
jgi:iron complex transport system substrate-binding protein